MKNKFKKSFRIKLLSSLFGIGVLASVSAVVASCANPDSKVVNNLFSSSLDSNQFSDSPNGSIKNVITNGLLQKDGYQALLKTKIAEILGTWYSKNQDPNVKNKYQKFVNDANDDWNKKVKDFQNQYGNNSEVFLQTNVLDGVGGTKDSWIQNDIDQKVLDDFTNQVFAKSFLNYTDGSGNITSATPEEIKDKGNWPKLKFTAGGFSKDNALQNNNQTFAELQNFIFNQWVEIENPNLISQVVFDNEEPKHGLKQIFNQNAVGSDNLNASYEFQAFKNNLTPKTSAKGMNAYKEISDKNGLAKYVDPSNDTIDFPNILSSDSNGKILMTASDMFNSYDVAFSSAFVFQYLRMLGLEGTDKASIANQTIDKIGNIKVQPNSSSTSDSDYNIISNFINAKNTELDYSEEYTVPNPQYNNIEVDKLSSFNQIYKNLVSPPPGTTYNIYNLAKPAYESDTAPKTAIPFNQFIFTRAKDGVHIIAIDGGEYYLNQSTSEPHQRVLAKQEEFLKFRAYLASLPNGISPGYSYTFDLNSQLKNWFNAHQVSLIYQFLASQSKDTSGTSIFTNNPDLKTAFDNFQSEFSDYINAFILYNQVLNLQNDIDVMRSKLNAWAQTYSDYLKNNTPEKIGIAAKLPYVREADGDYFGLLQYYLEILNSIDSTTKTPPPILPSDPSSVLINFNDNSIRGKTRELIIKEVNKKYQALTTATNNLVDSLDIQASNRIQYSQNLFIKSNKDSSLYLALNLVINATLTSDPVTSSIKMDYLTNSSDFKQIITADNKVNDTPVINNNDDKLTAGYLLRAIQNFYQQSAWNGLSDKTIYGNFIDQDQLNKKMELAWQNQLGVSAYSSNKLNYDLLLYTIYYLLKDNLANFKTILASQIYQGVDALVSWTVPTSPDVTTNPITNFEANPNYIQGAGWNKQTVTAPPSTTWNNTWFNTVVSPTDPTAVTAPSLSMTPDPFNDSNNFYNYTTTGPDTDKSVNNLNLYGFNGINTNTNTSNLDANVADAMFTNYSLSGTAGSLYSFGSKADLLSYIDRINNKNELDNLAKRLAQSEVPIANYYQQDANGKDIHTFAEKKQIIKDAVTLLSDDYFSSFTGFIGNSKQAVSSADTEASFLSAYQKSKPVNESGDNKLTVIAALIKQINYKDVNNLGTGSWWLNTDPGTGRLGLDLSAFLALVVQQAQDPATQSQAISYLIKNNNINDKNGSLIVIGDKRLYDALGNQWANK